MPINEIITVAASATSSACGVAALVTKYFQDKLAKQDKDFDRRLALQKDEFARDMESQRLDFQRQIAARSQSRMDRQAWDDFANQMLETASATHAQLRADFDALTRDCMERDKQSRARDAKATRQIAALQADKFELLEKVQHLERELGQFRAIRDQVQAEHAEGHTDVPER